MLLEGKDTISPKGYYIHASKLNELFGIRTSLEVIRNLKGCLERHLLPAHTLDIHLILSWLSWVEQSLLPYRLKNLWNQLSTGGKPLKALVKIPSFTFQIVSGILSPQKKGGTSLEASKLTWHTFVLCGVLKEKGSQGLIGSVSIRRCEDVWGTVLWRMSCDVWEAQAISSVTLSFCCLTIWIYTFQHHVCLLTTRLPTVTVVD